MKSLALGPFLGINNRRPDFGLITDKRTGECFLRSADNVDIDTAGKIHCREATALVQAMTGAHSLRMLTDTTGLLVRGSVLYAITLPIYSEALLKVLSSDAPMSYAKLGDTLYLSNGTDRLRMTGGVVSYMAMPTPAAPTISVVAGTLSKGWYQVSVSYRASGSSTAGEEGGISASANIELTTDNSGIHVVLPNAGLDATHVAVYCSGANGTVPYLHSTVAVGTASVDLTTIAIGHPAPQRFEDILPAGELFTSNGRLCSIVNSDPSYTVFVGLPFRPGYYQPVDGFIPFIDPVTLAMENQGGTYIGTTKNTFWIAGDLGDVKDRLANVLPYGAVQGTAFTFPDKSKVGWFGARGVVFASTNGEVEAVMSDNIDLVSPASGRSAVVDISGRRRVVSCGWCVNLDTKAATTYSGWGFTSVSGGYGTKADGVYLLSTTGAVDVVIGFGKQDFGVENVKYLPAAYLGVDCEEAMQMRIVVPNGGDYTYTARRGGTDMQIQRVDTGRGLKANWFDVYVMNQFGASFTLASVSLSPVSSTRSI
jgi:hypothetical protein